MTDTIMIVLALASGALVVLLAAALLVEVAGWVVGHLDSGGR